MKVYVCWDSLYEGCSLPGCVFSTKEAAKAWVNKTVMCQNYRDYEEFEVLEKCYD